MLQDKVQIIIKGEDKTDSIINYTENNGKIDITYSNGKTYSYQPNNVQIKNSALLNDTIANRFKYLKRIAECIGLQGSDGGNILVNHYSKIRFLSEESMLSAFLLGKLHTAKQINSPVAVYPFGFNMSQKTAVDNALKNPLTIIEGPPGTGKTQTILNIIANVIMRNESIAIVSNNNAATKNVEEKLKQYQVDFTAAYLGSSENKAKFINSQKPLPDMSAWNLSPERKNEIYLSLIFIMHELSTMLAKKNKLSLVRQEIDALELEYNHFCEYSAYGEEHLQCLKPATASTNAMELWLICEKYAERGKMPGFIERLINRFYRGVIKKEFYSSGHDKMIEICQRQWYTLRISEIKTTAMLLQTALDSFNFDEKMTEYTTLSAQLFRGYLAKKYMSEKRQQFELKDLWKNSEAFIQAYPVILSTAYSLRSSLSQRVMYDYVIIDESSQVDIALGALVLSCARKAVVVGDLKQLPNVVDDETAKKTDAVFAVSNLPEVFRYKNHSLLLAVSELFPNAPKILLREHYRCHPKIINFCNQKFYNNQLIILTESQSNRQPLMVYKTVPGNHARDRINQRQIDVIKNEIIPQQNLDGDTISVGIVTPYRNQTLALQNTFAGTGIQADTADKFQGREKKVIIFSTVDNQISQFADDANRLNVAVSRAIEQLIVVINSDADIRNTNIGDLVRYIEYNNPSTTQSKIQSIFDYLYKSYREQRNAILCKEKRISEYDSENLMYKLIREVLAGEERFMRFDVAVHIPLKMIIRDMTVLDESEKQYARNISTHVDFLIFDKIGKTPRLVIEVDGTGFHREGTKQAERDKKKNSILEKYGLPYIRFRTDESGEHEKLIAKLNGIAAQYLT